MDAEHIPEVKSSRSGRTTAEYRLVCVVNVRAIATVMDSKMQHKNGIVQLSNFSPFF